MKIKFICSSVDDIDVITSDHITKIMIAFHILIAPALHLRHLAFQAIGIDIAQR